MKPFFKKLQEENPEIYNTLIQDLEKNSIRYVANKYSRLLNLKPNSLYVTLVRNKNSIEKKATQENGKLTVAEIDFLERFRRGEVEFEEAQRELAYRVFKKILEDPSQLKAADWLRSELIKLKREEINLKKEQMDKAWAMVFGGFMIPKKCPKCGAELSSLKVSKIEEGEVIINDIKSLDAV